MNLSDRAKDDMTEKLKDYLEAELGVEIGQFEAGFLLEFVSEKLGPYFYNQGLSDAQVVLSSKLGEFENAILEIEKPLP